MQQELQILGYHTNYIKWRHFTHAKIQYMLNSFYIPHDFTLVFMLALIGYSLLFLHPYTLYSWGILSEGRSVLLSDSLLMAFTCLS